MAASQIKINNKITGKISVLKFGGTSVKDVGRILHVADIVQSRLSEGPLLVVVSAMGDTTDWLLHMARQCTSESELDNRELDQLLATGEQVSIALLAMVLRARGIRARSLTGAQAGIYTDSVHNNARVLDIRLGVIEEALSTNDVIVVAGFQGVTANGDITTLGRGGSDTSAVALAAACQAVTCDIYTDVDGILTCDPNVIRSASLLEEISNEDAAELARLGAQVIHPRAVELARYYRIPLRVRNTFKPPHPGTCIKGEKEMENYRSVTGVALDRLHAIICINGLSGSVKAVPQILELLASYNIAVDLINQNPRTSDNIAFTVSQAELARAIKILNSLAGEYPEIHISFDADAAKVSLIGAGIATSAGIVASAFGCLSKAGINIKLAATSDRRLTAVVAAAQADLAANALHCNFELEKPQFSCLQKTS